jgi:hypothetical protein
MWDGSAGDDAVQLTYSFTEEQAKQASDEWGANCGPNALAFVLQKTIGEVRTLIPDFERKRYTSPTMMKSALHAAGRLFTNWAPEEQNLFHVDFAALVRVQWTGPWTAPGMNPRWAYGYTHWIATWRNGSDHLPAGDLVFDVNGGIRTFESWKTIIVPILTGLHKRGDGGWKPTHIWRLM